MTITGYEELDKNGYQLFDILEKTEIDQLVDFYNSKNKMQAGYNPEYAEFSVLNSEPSIRMDIFNHIKNTILPKVDPCFPNYKPVLCNYVVKQPNGGFVPLHQNWAVVDETKFSSFSVWVPLTNATTENGTLQFVNGSHKNFRGPRGGYANRPFEKIEEDIKTIYLETVNVSMGKGIILDDSVLHYSAVNTTSSPRLAIQLIIVPPEADILYYDFSDLQKKGTVNKYIVDSNFYMNMTNWTGDLTKYSLVESIPFTEMVYTLDAFKKKMRLKSDNIFTSLFKRKKHVGNK